jgi:hypothetical protein
MEVGERDKRIILMLCKIWKKLDMGDEVETGLTQEAIHSGNYWAVSERHPGIFHDADNSEHRCDVGDILAMWERLEEDFEALSPCDKTRVQDAGHRSVASRASKETTRPGTWASPGLIEDIRTLPAHQGS